MIPAASITPAPAAPPAALARASGGLTRRRKVIVAIEIALIAAIVAFAWVRETPLSRAQKRVATIGVDVLGRFGPAMTPRQVASVANQLRNMSHVATIRHFQGAHFDGWELKCADPLPRFRWGLARTLFIRSDKELPGDALCFVLEIIAYPQDSNWRISVSDNGVPGLPFKKLASE